LGPRSSSGGRGGGEVVIIGSGLLSEIILTFDDESCSRAYIPGVIVAALPELTLRELERCLNLKLDAGLVRSSNQDDEGSGDERAEW